MVAVRWSALGSDSRSFVLVVFCSVLCSLTSLTFCFLLISFVLSGSILSVKMMVSFNVDDGLFKTYLFYSGILVLKALAMSLLTAKQRFTKMVFANPEDAMANRKYKVKYDDEDVERVRRAHLNDLENIPFFIIVCFGYLLTNPTVFIASNLIRLFVLGRIAHTIVYALVVLPQPSRALAWTLGYGITIYMAAQVVLNFA